MYTPFIHPKKTKNQTKAIAKANSFPNEFRMGIKQMPVEPVSPATEEAGLQNKNKMRAPVKARHIVRQWVTQLIAEKCEF